VTIEVAVFKAAIKSILASKVPWSLTRSLHPPGVMVLMYHRVEAPNALFRSHDPALFRSQMEWLARNCDPIAPSELRERCARPGSPRRSILVTFDDGFAGYYAEAYPILKRLGIPALVFLATASIDDPTQLIWPDVIHLAVGLTTRRRVSQPWNPGVEFDLSVATGRRAFLQAFKARAKSVSDAERLAAMHWALDALDAGRVVEGIPRQMMTWDEVRAASDTTSWGGHTHTHPILSRMSDLEIDREVGLSRTRIERETGTTPVYFAYPNGRSIDFDARCREVLVRHGFHTAFTTEEGLNGGATDWLAVRRLAGDGSVADLAWLVSGFGAARWEQRQ
jgi:peptidoglycan/xylan/chitin deacetylase (PgdA/CDA1 family)